MDLCAFPLVLSVEQSILLGLIYILLGDDSNPSTPTKLEGLWKMNLQSKVAIVALRRRPSVEALKVASHRRLVGYAIGDETSILRSDG